MTALNFGLGWSVAIAFLVIWGEIVSLLLSKHTPAMRSRFWNSTLFLSLALPVVFLAPASRGPDAPGPISAVFIVVARGSSDLVERTPLNLAKAVLAIWGTVSLVQVAKLLRGLGQLFDLTRSAKPLPPEDDMQFPVLETPRVATPSASIVGNVVLVPPSFVGLPEYWRRAVIRHESIHLQRRHGYAIVLEELVRCFFWFHPLVKRLISRVRNSREEVVDAETVGALGNHAEYRELLVALATSSRSLAPAVSGASSLCARLQSLTSLEKRLMPSHPNARVLCAVLALFGTTVSAYEVASAAALNQGAKAPDGQEPSVAERRKIVNVNPIYPESLKGKKISGIVVLEILIDPEGNVTETSVREKERTANADPAFVQASIDAVGQWKYAPAETWNRMTITLNFRAN